MPWCNLGTMGLCWCLLPSRVGLPVFNGIPEMSMEVVPIITTGAEADHLRGKRSINTVIEFCNNFVISQHIFLSFPFGPSTGPLPANVTIK